MQTAQYICIAWAAHAGLDTHSHHRMHNGEEHRSHLIWDLRVYFVQRHMHTRTNSSPPGTAEFEGQRINGSEKWADAAAGAQVADASAHTPS